MEYFGNIAFDETLINEDFSQQFIIYGAGTYGKRVFDFLKINKKEKQCLCFCDKNEDTWGSEVLGVPIIGPNDLEQYPMAHILVSGNYRYEILDSLLNQKKEKIHFLYF